VVCNAARQQSRESILDVTSEDFDATMKTNIYAPFWIIKAALPHLKPGSAIIGTTSEQAYDPSPELYDYAQTKAATMNYVESLAKQLGPKGIRVNGVAPGPIWTPLQVSGGASMEKLEKFGSQTVFKRPGQPVELASIYVQLAPLMRALLPVRFMGPPGAPASHSPAGSKQRLRWRWRDLNTASNADTRIGPPPSPHCRGWLKPKNRCLVPPTVLQKSAGAEPGDQEESRRLVRAQ
jgi:hypothetical protein